MAQRRSSNLAIAFSPTFKRQTTWDTPLAASELTSAFPFTSRNYLDEDETVEDVFDCTGEDFLFELLTGRLARLTGEFDVDPRLLAGWAAFNYGVAASPSGGTAEVQTITIGGTGGTWQAVFTIDYNRQVSAAIVQGATSAAVQTALRAMSNIGATGVGVAGPDGGPYVVTFAGPFVNRDVPMLEAISALTGPGAGVAIAETTPGVGRTHQINRLGVGLYQLPFTTLYVGFRGSNKLPLIWRNVVCDVLRCRSTSREKVTATVQLIGSGDLENNAAGGYVMPDCMDVEAVRFGDCSLLINGSDIYSSASPWAAENNGVAIVRDWEYYHQNDVLTGAHAFTGQGIDVTRLERADRRPSGLNIGVLGERGDPLFEVYRQQRPRSIVSAALRVGPANRNVMFNIPQAIAKLDSPPIRFEGEANESVVRLNNRPKKSHGDANTPSNITAVVEQSTAFLVAA